MNSSAVLHPYLLASWRFDGAQQGNFIKASSDNQGTCRFDNGGKQVNVRHWEIILLFKIK
jgi:hypothetical protein